MDDVVMKFVSTTELYPVFDLDDNTCYAGEKPRPIPTDLYNRYKYTLGEFYSVLEELETWLEKKYG